MKEVMTKYGNKGLEKIRSYDSYGTPIQLNYEGETTYKTLFGGILTIFFFVTLAFYCFIQYEKTKDYKDWSLTSQELTASFDELNQEIRLADHGNLRMGIIMTQKR